MDDENKESVVNVIPGQENRLPPGSNELKLSAASPETSTFANTLLNYDIVLYFKFLKLFNEEDRGRLLKEADLGSFGNALGTKLDKNQEFVGEAVESLGQDFIEYLASGYIESEYPAYRLHAVGLAGGTRWDKSLDIYKKYIDKSVKREGQLTEFDCMILFESLTTSLKRNFLSGNKDNDLPIDIIEKASSLIRQIAENVPDGLLHYGRTLHSLAILSRDSSVLRDNIMNFFKDKFDDQDRLIRLLT